MTLSPYCKENFDQGMRWFQHWPRSADRQTFIVSLILLVSFTGCSESSRGTNANSTGSGINTNGNGNANSGAPAASTQPGTLDFKEPERYSVAMTISAQAVSDAPTSMATQQFGFAKLGADRRWAFAFPAPMGQIVYLEKSGLKYLVFLDRNQYVEVMPDALGFQPSLLTPGAIAEELKPRAQYEKLGLEPVNGRTAVKYRLTGAGDASKKTDGLIFMDQETGLPLRCELNTAAQPGTNLRVIVEARDVQLNPNPLQFDVPVGMKKITPQEARPQIESFASTLYFFADIMSGKHTASSAANAIPSIHNKNANRRTR